jgi:DNA-binding response OmpR family regulator
MPETILVVDDDPDIARFVEVNLRSAVTARRRSSAPATSGRISCCSTS